MSDADKARALGAQFTSPQLSAAVRELNPHLFGEAAPTPPVMNAKPTPKGRQMNKTEGRYAAILEAMQRRGEIIGYRYEGVRLAWGRDEKSGNVMHYTPDFFVTVKMTNAVIEFNEFKCVEVKGSHIFDRDLVRFKGARAEWPQFDFEMWQWSKGEWNKIL